MFSFFKRPTKIIHTYNHVMGYQVQEFSLEEKDMIANCSQVIIKILQNKLMVVAIFSMKNSTNVDAAKTQWKQEILNELISYFTFYKEELEKEREIIPMDGQNF